jgi:hypothetical protein
MSDSSIRSIRRAALVGVGALACSAAVQAQGTIASRVAVVPDGRVRMAFTARPGVCGDGDDCITNHRGHRYSSRSGDVVWDEGCDGGPVRVVLTVRNHAVDAIHTYVGGRWRDVAPGDASVTDLGTVPAKDAANYLVGLARTLPSYAGRDAILPATLADSATIWPALVSLARDESRPSETRKQAVFWLGQAAGDVLGSLDSLATDNNVDREVREQAVFALSQRPRDEGVPALIRIAKTNRDPEVRRKALFWLGESGDPRAIDVFEEILTKQ